MKPYLLGFLAGIPFWLAVSVAFLAGLVQEAAIRADREAARSIMRQIRPGVQECYVERDGANCVSIIRGKRRTFVLAAG
jgi:hypothetical protein